jgi:hypothetical protein
MTLLFGDTADDTAAAANFFHRRLLVPPFRHRKPFLHQLNSSR